MEKNSKKVKVAWLHNYDTKKNPSSGVFMYQIYNALQSIESSSQIDLINIGSINNPLLIIIKFFKYRKTFKNYDILHAQYGSGTGFFTSLFSIIKIVSLRGSDWYYSPSRNFKEKLHIWLGCKLTRFSLHRFNRVIVMSERMKHDVRGKFNALNVDVIPDGLDLNKFHPIKNENNNVFRVLFSSVDKTNPVKRFELAQKAFSIFNKKYPKSELIFMNRIPHDKVNRFINSADAILLTSTHEGWPNIIKEGLACNVPFVSTDVSDLRIIAEKTISCRVCNDNSQCLSVALEDIAQLKTKEDLRKLVKQFDIHQIGKQIINLYNKI